MLKLYYFPGACSLSPHIALREAGIAHELVRVDPRSKKTRAGDDYLAINPKGLVPALQLADGEVLTEGPAIVQYLADLRPEAHLAPPAGSFARYRLQEWLNYLSTELHKGFSPFFNARTPPDYRPLAVELLTQRLDFLSAQLADKPYLMGETFTVADGYLFTILGWTRFVDAESAAALELARWPVLSAFRARVAARPAVQEALQAEGLKG